MTYNVFGGTLNPAQSNPQKMSHCATDYVSWFFILAPNFVLPPYLCTLLCNFVNVYVIRYCVHTCMPTVISYIYCIIPTRMATTPTGFLPHYSHTCIFPWTTVRMPQYSFHVDQNSTSPSSNVNPITSQFLTSAYIASCCFSQANHWVHYIKVLPSYQHQSD